jgi:hypothetical protein
MVLQIPRISITHLDFRKLISDRQISATRVNLDGVKFEDYLDKRPPVQDGKRPPMPGKMIAGIKFPVRIDTITVSNGFATYEEQTGDEPGRIFFDRLNATLTGFNTLTGSPTPSGSTTPSGSPTPSGYLDLHGTARLMGTAPMESWFHIETGHPRDTFTVRATIRELDLTSVNPMLSNLVPASISHGTATATEIMQINGNSTAASGLMSFRYHDLAIRLHPTKSGTWHQIEQWMLTEVANLYLADGNPNDDGKMKPGIIYFERDSSKGFFNFVWKSALSGIKSSVGVNSKTQKERKKQLKIQRNESKNNR